MNYEKIILELMGRVQALEEQVNDLFEKQEAKQGTGSISTKDIRNYIIKQKSEAKVAGQETLVLVARDIHRELKLKSRFPMVCNAMRQCMEEEDVILFQPLKGNSSTLEIAYKL